MRTKKVMLPIGVVALLLVVSGCVGGVYPHSYGHGYRFGYGTGTPVCRQYVQPGGYSIYRCTPY